LANISARRPGSFMPSGWTDESAMAFAICGDGDHQPTFNGALSVKYADNHWDDHGQPDYYAAGAALAIALESP
jgi:hypothetical protein